MTEIRVVSAVADPDKVIFYLENGDITQLKQTDPRLAKVLEVVIPLNTRGEVAIINLDDFSVYRELEVKTKGFVKFFKAAKSAVAGVFNSNAPVEKKPREQVLEPQPTPMVTEAIKPVSEAPKQSPVNMTRTREPIQSKPVETEPKKETSLSKHQKSLKPLNGSDEILDNETIVAVIGDIIIPNMESLKPYIAHALKNNSTIAVENFLKRIAPTIKDRGHSIQDLLRFMEKGDLPLAEDGSIIAYKMLNNSPIKDTYQDCHTGNVKQKVGSYVCVNEALVDRNRSNECSNGLHIARRGYLGGFSGNVCVLVKLAPEDVVTVPHNDPNKVRVMGYHILYVLSPEATRALKSNNPMTKDNEASNMLANAIKGNHVARLEEVRVRAQNGGNILITDLRNKKNSINKDESLIAEALDHNGDPMNGKPISPKSINQQVDSEIKKIQNTNNEPSSESLEAVADAINSDKQYIDKPDNSIILGYQAEAGKAKLTSDNIENSAQRSARIKREKRAAKKVTETFKSVEEAVDKLKKSPEPTKKAKPSVALDKAPKPSKNKPEVTHAAKPKVTPSKKPTVTKAKETPKPITEKPMTKVEQARKLYNTWRTKSTKANWDALNNFKKTSKVSWVKLGLTYEEEEKFLKATY